MSVRSLAMLGLAAATLHTAPLRAWPPEEQQNQELLAMRKAADALDEASDPAAYRAEWIRILEFARTLYPEGSPELAQIEGEQVVSDYYQGDVRGALARTARAAAVLETAGKDWENEWIDQLNAMVVFSMALGQHGDALEPARKILAWRLANDAAEPNTRLATAYSNYAHANFEFGNYDRAIELSRTAIATSRLIDPMPPEPANFFANLGVYLAAAGRLDEAIDEAREIQLVLEQVLPAYHPFLASNLNLLAVTLADLGRLDEAENTSRRALDIAVARFGEAPGAIHYMTTLADILLRRGKAEEARALASVASEKLRAAVGEGENRALLAREVHARALVALGERDAGLAELAAVAQLRADKLPPFHRDRLTGAERLAELALSAGNVELALRSQAEAQRLRAETFPSEAIATAAGDARLAALEARSGNAADGAARARAAAAVLDQRLAELQVTGSQRSGRDREIRAGYRWALDAAVTAGDQQLAFILAQAAIEGAAGQAMRDAALRGQVDDPVVAELLRARQDAGVELQAALDRQLRLAGRGASVEERLAAQARRESLEQKLEQTNAAVLAVLPDAFTGEPATRLTLAQAQAALAPDEVLMLVASGEARTTVFAVTREAVAVDALETGSRDLAAMVARLREGLTPDAVRGGAGFDLGLSRQLHAMLFGGEAGLLAAGKARMLVAANGALSALPFAVLAGAGGTDLKTADWLVRRHALVTLPSVSSLAEKVRSQEPRRLASFVAVGAPLLGTEASGGVQAFRSANLARQVRDLPALPMSGTELTRIGEALAVGSQTILTGLDATEAALRTEQVSRADVLAFATHGLLAGELEGLDEPALAVTPTADDDGLLTAAEIMRLRLDSEWILLSACNTAAGSGVDASGLAGLARAFLYAGGRNLLASHWAVRDDAAAALSIGTMQRYGQGAVPAEALRQAMLAMIDGEGGPGGSAQPLLWAPFVFIGR